MPGGPGAPAGLQRRMWTGGSSWCVSSSSPTPVSPCEAGPVSASTPRCSFFIPCGQRKAKLSSQPWADTNILTSCVADTVRLIKQNVPQCAEDAIIFGYETEFIHLDRFRSNILDCGSVSLVSTLRVEYSLDQQTIIGCPPRAAGRHPPPNVMLAQVTRSAGSRQSLQQ